MGHGFGLPHTDENFFNKDLNNCMDYTNNPENNKQPAEPNFKFLAQLYGTVDGSPVPTDDPVTIETNSTVTTSAADPNDVEEEEDETRSWKDVLKFWDRRRQLRQQLSAVAWAVDELDALIDNGSLFGIENENKNNNGWRRLHESSRGESHEFDLGQGFAVQIYLLR